MTGDNVLMGRPGDGLPELYILHYGGEQVRVFMFLVEEKEALRDAKKTGVIRGTLS